MAWHYLVNSNKTIRVLNNQWIQNNHLSFIKSLYLFIKHLFKSDLLYNKAYLFYNLIILIVKKIGGCIVLSKTKSQS